MTLILLNFDLNLIVVTPASFQFARQIVLGWLESQFHLCARASNLVPVGPPDSTTRKGPDNHYGEDAMFDVFPSQKPSVMQIKSSPMMSTGRCVKTCV